MAFSNTVLVNFKLAYVSVSSVCSEPEDEPGYYTLSWVNIGKTV